MQFLGCVPCVGERLLGMVQVQECLVRVFLVMGATSKLLFLEDRGKFSIFFAFVRKSLSNQKEATAACLPTNTQITSAETNR